jgi:hypothetical protein
MATAVALGATVTLLAAAAVGTGDGFVDESGACSVDRSALRILAVHTEEQ